MVKINGIPFFLMEDVQAYTGSKGNVALAFEERPSVGMGDTKAEDTQYNIELIARISHEVNRAYCAALGDDSQMSWGDAPDWQKDSAIEGVVFHLNGDHLPEASHNKWLEFKKQDGWKYGPVKDAEKKEHPCFVPYDQLPKEQQVKDYLFRAVVHSFK
ncbi:RyR domain-containing protein [Pectobacterium sp. B1J-3]|uniref:RyR domain-containing protein n=1 Tax=Pectobacterium sp. B1J-3 TaxID=3385371 RepID=UPI003906CCD8